MKQKNGKESVLDFVIRTQNDALTRISELNKFIHRTTDGGGDSGLSIADMGSKISKEEGKLEILRVLSYLIDDKRP